jgi:NADH pyrophosphatase NudC (nudix superfamily)
MLNGEKCVRCRKYFKFEELAPGPGGYGLCPDCVVKIDPNEKKRFCPNDGTEMKKEVIENLVLIDRCVACGGVWFDSDEIQVLKQIAQKGDQLIAASMMWTLLIS